MKYKVIADSSCEMPQDYEWFQAVPFGLEVNGENYLDDESMDVPMLLKKIAKSPTCPKSSCPSPQDYLDAFKTEAEHIYIVTISQHLSGSFNSALLAKSMYEEEHQDKKIAVIDSLSASGGESQIALLAMELEEQGKSFEEIEKELIDYRDQMHTYFVLDNLETLRKNGRLSTTKAVVANTLNIKPVMRAEVGTIVQAAQTMGIKKALTKMVDIIEKNVVEPAKKRVVITHCNNLERAEIVKKLLMEKVGFENILIMHTRGLSSLYANEGGVIVSY